MPRFRRLLCLLIVLLAAWWTADAFAARTTRITDVRVALSGGGTRLVVDSAGPLQAEIFALGSPDRLVVDLPVVEWPETATVRLPKSGLVTNLRFGRFDPDTSRLVMDLTGPVRLASTVVRSTGGGGHRLQVDLLPAGGEHSFEGRVTVAATGGQSIVNVEQRHGRLEAVERPKAPTPPSSQSPAEGLSDAAAGKIEALLAPPPPPQRPDSRIKIAIDAGHGGVDPGAIGTSGLTEKSITLAAARELHRQLLESGRYDVVMTRDSDVYVSLKDRVEIARSAGATLFVSLHADKHDSASLRGASVYTLSETASDAETEAYAQRENQSDIVAGLDLAEEYDEEVARILISLVQQSTMNCSSVFASALVEEIGQNSRLLPRPHRFAGFRVLKAPDVPSVLIELGYLSNREDERLLKSPRNRTRLMRAVVSAIDGYFDRQNC